MTEEEKKAREKTEPYYREEEEEEKRMMKSISHYFSMEWVGSNPHPEIIAKEPASFYYTYGGKVNKV